MDTGSVVAIVDTAGEGPFVEPGQQCALHCEDSNLKPGGPDQAWVSGLTGTRIEDGILRGQGKWMLFHSMPGALVKGSRECGLSRLNSAITGGEATGTQ